MKKLAIFLVGVVSLFSITFAQGYEVHVTGPVGRSLPKNAVSVELLNISIAAEENLYLSELWVTTSGLVEPGDFRTIWATTGNYQRSLRTRVLSDNRARIRFFRPVFIPAGTTENFQILASLRFNTGGRTFGLNFEKAVFKNSSLSLRRPTSLRKSAYLKQNQVQSISNFEVPDVEFSVAGSSSRIRMGTVSELGKFRLTNSSRKDVNLKSIRFRNYGNADLSRSFDSFFVQESGRTLPVEFSVDRRYITLFFDDAVLKKGDSTLLSLKARLIYAGQNDNVELGVKNQRDFVATLSGTDFGVGLTDFEDVRLKEHTLRPGGITTGRYSGRRNPPLSYFASRRTFQEDTTYSPGARDVTFLHKFFTQKNYFTVQGVFFPLDNRTIVSDKNDNSVDTEIDDLEETYNDFRLYINGVLMDSTNRFDSVGGQIGLNFEAEFEIRPQTEVRIVGRISSKAKTGDKLGFDFYGAKLFDPDPRQD